MSTKPDPSPSSVDLDPYGQNPLGYALLLTALAALLLPVPAQAQEWAWAHRAGGAGSDDGRGLALDGAGNTYVTGGFAGTVDFGAFTLTSRGVSDVFVAKYSPEGEVLWARRAGGNSFGDSGSGIAVDDGGNAYVTGYFQQTADFGPFALTSAGSEDVFVAKYSPEGEVLWARRAGGTSFDYSGGIAVDGAGNAYVTGYFAGAADFGGFTLTSAGLTDVFVAKYSPEGEALWAERAGGPTAISDGGNDLALDGVGNAYVNGYFAGTADFGGFTLTSVASADPFVAKYSPGGEVLWAERAGAAGFDDYGMGIAVDGAGNAYATGRFQQTADFGGFTLTSAGAFDVYLAKYSPEGEALWARRGGGADFDSGAGIAVDDGGNAYVTGYFQQTADFGGFTLASAGGADVFLAKYSPEGEMLWAERAGGPGFDFGTGLAVGAGDNAYATGAFVGMADFGPFTLASAGDQDVFVVRLGGTTTAAEPAPAAGEIALGAYPSPASGRATATFRLDRPGPVRLALYDVLGREVAVVTEGVRSSGEHAAPLDIWRLLPGFYVLRLQTKGGTATRSLTVVR